MHLKIQFIKKKAEKLLDLVFPFIYSFLEYWVEFLAFYKSYWFFCIITNPQNYSIFNVFQLFVNILFDFQIVSSRTGRSPPVLALSLWLPYWWYSNTCRVHPEYFPSRSWSRVSKGNPSFIWQIIFRDQNWMLGMPPDLSFIASQRRWQQWHNGGKYLTVSGTSYTMGKCRKSSGPNHFCRLELA